MVSVTSSFMDFISVASEWLIIAFRLVFEINNSSIRRIARQHETWRMLQCEWHMVSALYTSRL